MVVVWRREVTALRQVPMLKRQSVGVSRARASHWSLFCALFPRSNAVSRDDENSVSTYIYKCESIIYILPLLGTNDVQLTLEYSKTSLIRTLLVRTSLNLGSHSEGRTNLKHLLASVPVYLFRSCSWFCHGFNRS